MPMWPFGRRRGPAKGPIGVSEGKQPAASPAHAIPNSDALQRRPSRRSSRRKRRASRASTVSMHDAEKDILRDPEKRSLPRGSVEDITALPYSKHLEQSPHLRPVTLDHAIPYNFQPNSHHSLPPTAKERGKLQRPQSLRHQPYESALPRRKSSKKRKNDPVREEEIRAMSMPLPQKRPAGKSGDMLRRDSKKVKGNLNRRLERPTSDVSLPLEDSIHSSMSGNSESRAFRVSALDMFSPRPKIRYSLGSQHYYGGAGSSPPTYPTIPESKRERRTNAEKGGKDDRRNQRIDDLANTLDAGALREILERDKRRREKKRRADEEKLRRRLERRAEKQKAAEQGGTPATPKRDAHGVVGLGIQKDTAAPMEDVRPSTPPPSSQRQKRPQKLETPPAPKHEENNQLPTPLDSPVDEAVVADAQAVRYSRASLSSPITPSHTREPSDVSQMPELLSKTAARHTPSQSVEALPDPRASSQLHPIESHDTVTSKKGSSRRRSSEGRRMGVFASWFRRGKRNSQDQGRTTPSEVSFSNTSRESMSKQPLPPHLAASEPIQIRRPSKASGVPHRTMSKFREDLPDFPLSPPDSRVQSPEVTSASALAARRRAQTPTDIRVGSTTPGASGRTDSPVSPGVSAPGLMSQSMASVDSEGSWLSGKPIKRRSNKSHLRSSVGSSARPQEEFNNPSYEELGIPDDEYFRKLTPQLGERRRSGHSAVLRKASSTVMVDEAAESDNEEPSTTPEGTDEAEEKVKSSVGRTPTIVHRQPRVKSTEGLLSFFQGEKAALHGEPATSAMDESPDQESPVSDEPVSFQRANHVRHLSAGSAKLLNIPARSSSVDQKRSSLSSQTKLPNLE